MTGKTNFPFDLQDERKRKKRMMIFSPSEFFHSLSIFLLSFLFFYCRAIRCDRITVHVHLMAALAMRFLLLIVITEPFIFRRTNHYRTIVSRNFILLLIFPSIFMMTLNIVLRKEDSYFLHRRFIFYLMKNSALNLDKNRKGIEIDFII